jgi:hypothetical protein
VHAEHHGGPARFVEPVASAAQENIRADRAEVRGPHPVVRAILGLLLGLAAGGVAIMLIPKTPGHPVPAGPASGGR